MKKILILVMSCNDEFFKQQVEKIKQTWAKPILDGKYSNIDFMSYDGWDAQHYYDKDNKCIHIRCEDDLDNTYKKTFYALSIIKHNFDYDYVFRTNTSTFINVDLLNKFVQRLDNDEILWTSEVYSLVEANAPYPLCLYGRGNGLLFSKKLIDILLKEGITMLYEEHVDDVVIGNILNSYWIKQDKNYTDYIKSYYHGWYRAITVPTNNGHKLCNFNCDSNDPNFWKYFITIQTKMYRQRNNEDENMTKLYSIMNNIESTEEDVDKQFEYSKNYSVFVGSGLGYMDLNRWLHINKQELFRIECNNKTNDDVSRKKFHPNKIWY